MDVAGHRTRVLELADAGPGFVLLHGWGDSADTWRPLLAELAGRGRRAIAVDLPGFGHASRLAPGAILPQLDDFAAALVLEWGGGEPVVVAGNSLGGAVALRLALESPPRGLILQSAFTSVRDMARVHYPFVPRALVPDAYPSLARIGGLRAPLLVLHGAGDEIVPLMYGEALFEAARCEKQFVVLPGAGHNDPPGDEWAGAIAWFAAC